MPTLPTSASAPVSPSTPTLTPTSISPSTPTPTSPSAVLSIPPAASHAALAHFANRLSFEADVSDVHADLAAGVSNLVIVDSRSLEAWDQGHLPGATHLPTNRIAAEAASAIPPDATVVTYCWGPGCNGATRAALEFAKLGYPVKEMIGGYEYWVREGFAYETKQGQRTHTADPLTAPADGTHCAC
jgi:rhodanese-related sulfurtransferase